MKPSLLPGLLLCGVAIAQQPSLEVTDLLSVEASRKRADEVLLVQRAELPGGNGRRHIVAGEGQLAQREDDERAPARPFFTPKSLPVAVAALRAGRGGGLEFVPVGERTLVRGPELEQVEAAVRELRRALPPRLSCSFRLERVDDGETVVLLSGSEAFRNGETVIVGDIERSTAVVDADVEVAQAAVSSNPVTVEQRHGASAMLRARALPGSDAAIVEAVLRMAAPIEAAPLPGSSDLGALNRLANRFDEAGVVFRVARGVESRHEWTALDGGRVALVCRVDWTSTPAATNGAVASAWVTPLLHAPVLGFRSIRASAVRASAAEEQVPIADLAAASMRAGDDGGDAGVVWLAPGEGGGALVLRGEDGHRFARDLERRIDETLAGRAVELEVFDAPAGAAPDAADVRSLWRCTGPGVVGLPSCFATGRERSYVRDWQIEVAQGARIADPDVALAEDGWFATVKPLRSGAGTAPAVEFAVERIDFVSMQTEELALAGPMVAATESGRFALPKQVVAIERPVTRQVELGGTFVLDQNGEAVVRRAAARLLGPGRELVVRVRVR